MPEKSEHAYKSTAYNSQNITKQPKPTPKGFLKRLLSTGKTFPFRDASETIATTAVAHNTPSQWLTIVDFIDNKQGQTGWDEQRLEQDRLSGWSYAYLVISSMGKVSCQFILPLFVLVCLTMPLYDDRTNFIQAMEVLGLIILYGFLPCALLWIQFELMNHGYITWWFLKARKQFSLNRQTGMVTLYKSNGKPRFSHPFIEFDCILQSIPNQQGLLNYALYLVHRYNGYTQGIPLNSLMPEYQLVAEYQALWNMIQRYMDVSKPMPDILILEAARERDPTTSQFDKEGHRAHSRNYWRDMSDEAFTEALEAIRLKQQKFPAFGPSIDIFGSVANSDCGF